MTNFRKSSLLILGLLIGGEALAGSQTITFKVPIHLQNLAPEVTGFTTTCWVRENQSDKNVGMADTSQVVQKAADGTGSFNGIHEVSVNVADVSVPKAKYYTCSIWLEPMHCTPGSNTHPACNRQAGSALTHNVGGPLAK